MYFCEFSKILAEHLQMAGPGFCTGLYVSLQNSFHQADYIYELLFFECIQHMSTVENYPQKK